MLLGKGYAAAAVAVFAAAATQGTFAFSFNGRCSISRVSEGCVECVGSVQVSLPSLGIFYERPCRTCEKKAYFGSIWPLFFSMDVRSPGYLGRLLSKGSVQAWWEPVICDVIH